MAIQIQISSVDKGRGVVDVGGIDVPLEELGTKVQYLTMRDEIVCEICMSHHGEVNDAGDMGRPFPPLHRRCRCIEQPYIEGVSPDKQPKFGAMQMWIDGQAPDQAGWSAAKLQAYRKELLGKEASELYAQGKIALDDVITATHERRTLAEIKNRVSAPRARIADVGATSQETLSKPTMKPKKSSKTLDSYFEGRGVAEVDIGGYSKTKAGKILKEIDNHMDDVFKAHPGIEAKFLEGTPEGRLSKISLRKGESFPTESGQYVAGQYFADERILEIAGDIPFTIEGYAEIGNGIWTRRFTGNNFKAVFRHELGHHSQRTISTDAQARWVKLFDSKDTEWWKTNTTEYASTNFGEAFAECFAVFSHPEYKAKAVLPSEIHDFFMGVFG